jgi:predicted DNA-binding protein
MPAARPGGTQRQTTVRMSAQMMDRLIAISARLNLPVSEVIVRLMIAGLDCTQDLALDERASEGVAKFRKVPVEQ